MMQVKERTEVYEIVKGVDEEETVLIIEKNKQNKEASYVSCD